MLLQNAPGDIRQIAVTDGTAFYTIASSTGQQCYLIGAAVEPREAGMLACFKPGEAFTTPLIDFSVVELTPGELGIRLKQVQGFASDSVATVAVLDENGTRRITPVVNDTYLMASDKIPAGIPSAIIALDGSGNVLWQKVLNPEPG